MPSDFYNSKRFHSIVLQGICDVHRIFWNVCASQPCRVHDAGQFVISSLHTQLNTRQILAELIIWLHNIDVQPFLLDTQHIQVDLICLKNYKHANPAMINKMRFDSIVNDGRVVIEQVFGSLKN